MAKPIFVIRYPFEQQNYFKDNIEMFLEKMPDYYLFFVPSLCRELIFECYNMAHEVDEIRFEEFQKEIFKTHLLANT